MLEASKSKHLEALNYLANKKAFSNEFNNQFDLLRKNANNNLIIIKANLVFIENLQKSSASNKK
jgi:hypothetical protein